MRPLVWLALSAGALWWGLRRSYGLALPDEAPEANPAPLPGFLESIYNQVTDMPETPVFDANDARARRGNLAAFLDMLAVSEGTANGPDRGYRTLVGGGLFEGYDEHPAVTGPWRGLPLSDELCRGAGQAPGCVSTAAGRYQIIRPTWRVLKRDLSLADFSPASQDAAAVELIRRAGALGLVESGQFGAALDRVRGVWASLPGAGYGQHENALLVLQDVYTAAGGALA